LVLEDNMEIVVSNSRGSEFNDEIKTIEVTSCVILNIPSTVEEILKLKLNIVLNLITELIF